MTIALGIVVAYVVGDGNERLLDLHLERIERHTTVPYVIHGSVNRLLPACCGTLERHPRVRVHELPPTDLRGVEEHSYYLERLVGIAIEGGASHIAILHVDSFPIRDGWAEALVARLSDSCVFVTIEGVNTACLVFHCDFYLAHKPPFLLSPQQLHGAAYATFVRETGLDVHHSGTGFAFEAHRRRLRWSSMPQSSRDDWGGAAAYDDLLFHLKGTLNLTLQVQHSPRSPEASSRPMAGLPRRLGFRRCEAVLRAGRSVIPPRLRRRLRARFGRTFGTLIDEPRLRWHTEARDALLADPEGFVEKVRGTRCRV